MVRYLSALFNLVFLSSPGLAQFYSVNGSSWHSPSSALLDTLITHSIQRKVRERELDKKSGNDITAQPPSAENFIFKYSGSPRATNDRQNQGIWEGLIIFAGFAQTSNAKSVEARDLLTQKTFQAMAEEGLWTLYKVEPGVLHFDPRSESPLSITTN